MYCMMAAIMEYGYHSRKIQYAINLCEKNISSCIHQDWKSSSTKNINIDELKVGFVPHILGTSLPNGSHLGKWRPQYEKAMCH